jgi:hypothetical protein
MDQNNDNIRTSLECTDEGKSEYERMQDARAQELARHLELVKLAAAAL